MSKTTVLEDNASAISHIGPARHRRRNLWLAVAVLGAALGMASHFAYWGRQNTAATERLDRFQVAYSQRCDAAAFPESSTAMVKKLYLGSSRLRTAVDRELGALEAGAACGDVYKALRAADFPIAAPLAGADKALPVTVQPPTP